MLSSNYFWDNISTSQKLISPQNSNSSLMLKRVNGAFICICLFNLGLTPDSLSTSKLITQIVLSNPCHCGLRMSVQSEVNILWQRQGHAFWTSAWEQRFRLPQSPSSREAAILRRSVETDQRKSCMHHTLFKCIGGNTAARGGSLHSSFRCCLTESLPFDWWEIGLCLYMLKESVTLWSQGC